jgi:hypothetical protein
MAVAITMRYRGLTSTTGGDRRIIFADRRIVEEPRERETDLFRVARVD